MYKRFDYFPRGINEAFEELEVRKKKFPDMSIEKSLMFYYRLPRLLATNRGNFKLAKRITEGLKIIMSNGLHMEIWLKYNRKWVKEAKIQNRRIINLKNPSAIQNLPYDDQSYWFQPGESWEN